MKHLILYPNSSDGLEVLDYYSAVALLYKHIRRNKTNCLEIGICNAEVLENTEVFESFDHLHIIGHLCYIFEEETLRVLKAHGKRFSFYNIEPIEGFDDIVDTIFEEEKDNLYIDLEAPSFARSLHAQYFNQHSSYLINLIDAWKMGEKIDNTEQRNVAILPAICHVLLDLTNQPIIREYLACSFFECIIWMDKAMLQNWAKQVYYKDIPDTQNVLSEIERLTNSFKEYYKDDEPKGDGCYIVVAKTNQGDLYVAEDQLTWDITNKAELTRDIKKAKVFLSKALAEKEKAARKGSNSHTYVIEEIEKIG